MRMRPATAPRGQALVLRMWIVIASPARVNRRVCPRKGRNDSADLRTDRVLLGGFVGQSRWRDPGRQPRGIETENEGVVDQNIASWNPLLDWLHQIDGLRLRQ
jgi:hypothetical protein